MDTDTADLIAEITTRPAHIIGTIQSMEEFHFRVKSMLRLLGRNYFNDGSLLTSLYGPGPGHCLPAEWRSQTWNYRSSPVKTATMVGVTGQ